MYGIDLDYGFNNLNGGGLGTYGIISLVIAICGAILVYVLFLNNNQKKYKGIVKWLYDFLNFDKLTIENILKFTYILLTFFITLISFSFIKIGFMSFLMVLIGGNVCIRISYELTIVLVKTYHNVKELNKKIK